MKDSKTVHSSQISGLEEIDYSTHFQSEQGSRIEVGPDGKFRVILPPDSNFDSAEKILQDNREWIQEQQSRLSAAINNVEGDIDKLTNSFVFQGKPYKLQSKRGRYGIDFQDERCIVSTPKNRSEITYLKNWLKDYLRETVESTGEKFADELGVEFGQIYVRNQKTKWASCSSRSNLSFNIRSAFLPHRYFEYLAAHEIAHLEHPHHGEEFWNELQAMGFRKEMYESALDGYWILSNRNSVWQDLISNY